MRIGEFNDSIETLLRKRKKLLVVGPSGIGKTQVPEDMCKRIGWDCKSVCMPMVSPTFLMGYPFRENGTAGHLAFGVIGECLNATRDTVLVFDELGGASNETVKAALRGLQFGEFGGKRLPDCVRMIAMSNDIGHGADVQGIIEPMKDRFDSIINVEPNVDDSITYGLAHNWPGWLLGFLRNDPKALHDLKPLKSMQRSGATPRGYDKLAAMDNDGLLDSDIGPELAHGCVGKGRGTEAMAYRGLINELPDINQVLIDPDGSPVPENPSARFLIAMSLASRLDANTFGQALKYLNRLPPMFRAYSIRDAIKAESARQKAGTLAKGHKPIHASRDFTAWSCSSDGKDVMSAAS